MATSVDTTTTDTCRAIELSRSGTRLISCHLQNLLLYSAYNLILNTIYREVVVKTNNLLPRLIEGNCVVDDRGILLGVNDFGFEDVRRFYIITNHRSGFVRAWHAHRQEAKYVTVCQGAAVVGAVQIDDWERPSKDAVIYRHTLSALKPAILFIPAGFANGTMNLTSDTMIIFFSTSTIEESKTDDIRFPARYWDIGVIRVR